MLLKFVEIATTMWHQGTGLILIVIRFVNYKYIIILRAHIFDGFGSLRINKFNHSQMNMCYTVTLITECIS